MRPHNAGCRAHAIKLALLTSGHRPPDEIAEAFVLAGLGDALHYTRAPRPPATARPGRLPHEVHGVHRRHLARVAQRRRRRARTT